MNKQIQNLAFIIGALVLVVLMIISVLTSGGNEIGKFATYLSICCFLLGLMSPKVSMFLLLLLAGYSDLLKRFMILGSSISELDLVYVLAMAPLTLAGVVLHVFMGQILKMTATKADLTRFLICTCILVGVGGSAALNGGGVKSLRVVADYGAFVYLLYVFPVLFPSREELLKYTKFALYVFIPVAIYCIWQRVYGFADFELDYLATGLSIESRQLGKVGIRPFSTLNAATSLTIVMSACAMISYFLMRVKLLRAVVGALLIALFTTACIMTFTRAGWVTLGVSPFVVVAFRYKSTTIATYLLAISLAITVVYHSDWFLNNLHTWQHEISGDHGGSTQAFKVTTLYDRFIGFSNLKNPDNWAPFGIVQETSYGENHYDGAAFSHDMISRFIFKWGYIPSSVVFILGCVVAWRLHSRILSQPIKERKITTLATGFFVSLLISVAAGSYVFQFPANIFLCLLVCVSGSCLTSDTKELELAEEDEIQS